MSNKYIDAAVSNKIEDLDKKIDKLLSLIDDIKSGKQPKNLMEWRVAALKKLERTQNQIDSLINIIQQFNEGMIISQSESHFSFIFPSTTLDEYEQSHTLHLEYIIKRLTNIRDNIFKE